MRAVDRKYYSASDAGPLAYKDCPHSIGYNATISAPHMHAFCLEELADLLVPGARILDVGSGSGYLTACMAQMIAPNGHVLGIDIIPQLVTWSNENMRRANPELLDKKIATLIKADGWQELKGQEFDMIHVGAAAAKLPDALVKMLRPNGRMIIPVGTTSQAMLMITRLPDGSYTTKNLMGVVYVPLVNTGKPNDGVPAIPAAASTITGATAATTPATSTSPPPTTSAAAAPAATSTTRH